MKAKKNPAGVGAPAEFKEVLLDNQSNATLPSKPDTDKRIKSLRPNPQRNGFWLMRIDALPEFSVRDAKIRSAKRVVNIAAHQGVVLVNMPDQKSWSIMVSEALAAAQKGGAS